MYTMDLIRTTYLFKFMLLHILMLCPHMCLSSTKLYNNEYIIKSIENDKVCSPIKKKHIHLGVDDTSAVILKESRYFDTWYGDHDFMCKIKVELMSPGLQSFPLRPNGGIFAVIQNISLRQNLHTRECIDYIQFKRSNGEKSLEFCGHYSSIEPDSSVVLSSSPRFSPYSFIDPDAKMDVTIFIGKQMLRRGEKIDFTIALTAYRECRPYATHETYATCDQQEAESHESGDFMVKHKYCIWRPLFNDTIVNCPHIGCYEESCVAPRLISYHGSSTAVTVGSLASVILIFFVFISSLWICRKCQVLFWKPRASPATAVVHFSEDAVADVVGTAPSLSNNSETATPDKDPPPSYDSLFPPKPSES